MVFWPWCKDYLLEIELILIGNRLELMAKTIRSHPTSHTLVLANLLDYSYIFKIWTQNGPTYSSFSNFSTSKKTTPQRKKDAHGPSLHIRFLSKCHFWYGIYNIFSIFSEKPTFLNYCHILMILCISDSNIGDPILLLFQNRTLISKLEREYWHPAAF